MLYKECEPHGDIIQSNQTIKTSPTFVTIVPCSNVPHAQQIISSDRFTEPHIEREKKHSDPIRMQRGPIPNDSETKVGHVQKPHCPCGFSCRPHCSKHVGTTALLCWQLGSAIDPPHEHNFCNGKHGCREDADDFLTQIQRNEPNQKQN